MYFLIEPTQQLLKIIVGVVCKKRPILMYGSMRLYNPLGNTKCGSLNSVGLTA